MRFLLVPAISLVLLLQGCGGSGNNDAAVIDLELTAASIELDPYGTAPLSARLRFTPPETGRLKITVAGKGANGIAMTHEHDELVSSVDHALLGLYPSHINTVTIEFDGQSGRQYADTVEVATAPLNVSPAVEVIDNSGVGDTQNVYLFSRQHFAFDANGDARWAYTGNAQDLFRKLADGSLIASINENPIRYHVPKFAVITMLGEKLVEYSVPEYLHHEVRKLPWGNYLVAGNSSLIDFATNGVPEEDTVVEIDADTGLVVKVWDFNQILDPARAPIPSNDRPDDWLHLNSAVYVESEHCIYITAQRQSLVAKIDYETGALRWILGAHELWGPALQDKLLTAVDSNGAAVDVTAVDFWPYGPHAVLPQADGVVAVYDNGAYRGWYADNSVTPDSYSRGVEYRVDETAMTVELIWQYDAGKQIFTAATGDIDLRVDANDNAGGYLIGFAGSSDVPNTPRVIEVTRDGAVIFEAVSGLGEQQYRVEKLDLYDGL